MEFKQKEIEILRQTLAVPLKAFGKERLEKKVGSDQFEKAKLLYDNLEKNNQVSKEHLVFLATIFLHSRDIIDFIEYPTLTGFSWEESTDLIVKILKNI